MAHLNSVWEKADSSYIRAMKPGGRTPVSRRLFPQASSERNQPGVDRAEEECEDASETSSVVDFDAIPEEFRPSRRGKDLMKVKASPQKGDSKDKVSAGKSLQNERFPNGPLRKRGIRNSNSSTAQNEVRNHEKEVLKTEESEQPHRDIGVISDETRKQNKPSGMFFYSYSSQNESASKATNGCQGNWSEKENNRKSSEKTELKNSQHDIPYRRFYDPDRSQSKETNELDKNSFFVQQKENTNSNKNMSSKYQDGNINNQNKDKEETNFPRYNTTMPPKFQDENANNQSRDKDETNYSKYNTNMFQDRIARGQNKASLADKGSQKFTREVTVEKRIKWKNDLCEFKKPENKPNFFYEYKKTTKESVSYVPAHSEDDNNDDNEVTKTPYQDLKKGRDFCKNFSRKDFGGYKQHPENQKREGFDSARKSQRNEAKYFAQKSANKFEERRTCFQYGNCKDPIIVRHEIKVIHVNQQGKNSRMFRNSYQRPRNERNGKTFNNDPRRRNDKINHSDTRERNGKIINSDLSEHCGAKMEENTMTKTTEVYQKARKNFVKIPMMVKGPSSKTEYACNNACRTSNGDNAAALVKYGREISDMIAGSYVAISTFLDNYEQWKEFRHVTMLLFQEVEKTLSQSCHGNKRIIEVASWLGTGCKMIQIVPHPGVSIAAKVIAFLSEVVTKIFSSSNSAQSIGIDDFQLKLSLQRDMEATSDIYMYGVQCDINFQETCQLIEEFHREIQDGRFREFEQTFETGFLKEISQLNPKHPAVFYKKLGRFYKLLNEQQRSEEGEAFCGAFEDWPDALTTVSRLHRRFKTEGWDSRSVMRAWEEVYDLLQNEQSVVEAVLKKIQDCICVLMREQSVMERYVMDLQRQC